MSTTAMGLPPNVEVYLAALRAELADLAPEERDDLLLGTLKTPPLAKRKRR